MEGRMKRLGKYKAVIALLCFTATIFSGCSKKPDAVITDGGDVTVVSAEHETVEESSADIFTYKDLKIGNVSYLMTESQVMAILGKPTEETETNGKKIYSYNEMSIGFQKLNNNNKPDWNGTYKVVQAASIGNNDVFSRDLRVGDSTEDILKCYYRDTDYQDNLYTSEDKSVEYGKFLYGDSTISDLNKTEKTDTFAYGLINYKGYSSMETAESYNIEFTYFDGKYKSDKATIYDDYATLDFEIDNNGKITAVSWVYNPERN